MLQFSREGGWCKPVTSPQLRILFLDSSLAKPLSVNTAPEVIKSGRILEMSYESAQHPIKLIKDQALPDGLDYCYADTHL